MFLLQEVERQSQADLDALQERGLSGQSRVVPVSWPSPTRAHDRLLKKMSRLVEVQ